MSFDESAARSLIVGVRGQVGSQLLELVGPHRALGTSRSGSGGARLDLSSLGSLSRLEYCLGGRRLDAIYCAGGMTSADGCEHDTEMAIAANCDGPALLARYARVRSLPFVYFSSEYVFDGHGGPYREQDTPAPLSAYGRSKLAGEAAVITEHPSALVLRTTVVYGPDQEEKNFFYAVRRGLAGNRIFQVAGDQISTPTYNRDLANAAIGLVRKGAAGIFHVCGPERLSRAELACRAAAFWGLNANNIRAVTTLELGQAARRPLHAGLRIDKLRRLHPELAIQGLDAALRDWSERTGRGKYFHVSESMSDERTDLIATCSDRQESA